MALVNAQEHDVAIKSLLDALERAGKATPILTGCEAGRGHALRVKRRRLALVFVPGIMASRLTNGEEMIWDPDKLGVMKNFLGAGPAKRQAIMVNQKRLLPPAIEDFRGKIPAAFPYALERGWHTVSWTYYGDLLQGLEEWATPLKALVDMPVYAFGYDWMSSNKNAGKALRDFINKLDADKVIIVSHSMGGLATRSCYAQLADKSRILGVIHGAQPAMGAPAAYRRQKAGFEAHSLGERIVSFVLGKDGPNVRAIFPFGSGPLELLPCGGYRDLVEKNAWFFYDVFVNGSIETRSVPPQDIYEQVYARFDDEVYYGMLSHDYTKELEEYAAIRQRHRWSAPPEKPQFYKEPNAETIKLIKAAKKFHADLAAAGIHPRTVQLCSSGNPTSCTVHWKALDLTQKILNHDFDAPVHGPDILEWSKNIRSAIPGPIDGANDYYELRWLEKDWSVGECIVNSRPRQRAVKGKDIQDEIRRSGRHVAFFNLTGKTQGSKSEHWSMQGDGTVPVSSAIALPTSDSGWGSALPKYLPRQYGKAATLQTNTAEHTKFFEAKSIQATKNAIHDLCLAWLKEDIT